jgi:hypothetical protein
MRVDPVVSARDFSDDGVNISRNPGFYESRCGGWQSAQRPPIFPACQKPRSSAFSACNNSPPGRAAGSKRSAPSKAGRRCASTTRRVRRSRRRAPTQASTFLGLSGSWKLCLTLRRSGVQSEFADDQKADTSNGKRARPGTRGTLSESRRGKQGAGVACPAVPRLTRDRRRSSHRSRGPPSDGGDWSLTLGKR